MKVGDCVVVFKEPADRPPGIPTLVGKTGVVKEINSWSGCSIEFDEYINGHTCEGTAKPGYGYQITASCLAKMEPVKELLKRCGNDLRKLR